jgi:hypothetical protein
MALLHPLLLLAILVSFAACGANPTSPQSKMDLAIAELMAKPEVPDEAITVQHVLVAFRGAERSKATRSFDDAKVLAEKIWVEVMGGADFKPRMAIDDDPGPGEYPMTKAKRTDMAKGFGDVGFRLKVGEIGVAPFHPTDSKFGWHIIKRVK